MSVRERTRIKDPKHGGKQCPTLREERQCKDQEADRCPVHCQASAWGGWSDCSTTCGVGQMINQRFIQTEARYGGGAGNCLNLTMYKPCNDGPCPLNCTVSQWGAWTDCSRTCGTGNHARTRSITQQRTDGGSQCPSTSEEGPCEQYPCPIPCSTGVFDPWSECSRSCGGGTQSRVRPILQAAQFGGMLCNATRQTRDCNTHACKMHHFWTPTAVTPSPTPFDIGHAYNHRVHQGNQNNSKAKVLGSDASKTWTAADRAAVNAQTHAHENEVPCTNGNDTVPSGWHGAGVGANYCNLCSCLDGELKCQKRDCGIYSAGEVCQHITCEVKTRKGHGDHHLTDLDGTEQYMKVHHNHLQYEADDQGTEHKCINNPYTKKCTCYCFAAGTTQLANFGTMKTVHQYAFEK